MAKFSIYDGEGGGKKLVGCLIFSKSSAVGLCFQTQLAARQDSSPPCTPESQHRLFQLYPQLMKVISESHQTPTSSPCPGKSVCSFLVSIDQSLRVESAEPDTRSLLSAAQATFKHQHGSPFERHSIAFVCLLFCSLVN